MANFFRGVPPNFFYWEGGSGPFIRPTITDPLTYPFIPFVSEEPPPDPEDDSSCDNCSINALCAPFRFGSFDIHQYERVDEAREACEVLSAPSFRGSCIPFVIPADQPQHRYLYEQVRTIICEKFNLPPINESETPVQPETNPYIHPINPLNPATGDLTYRFTLTIGGGSRELNDPTEIINQIADPYRLPTEGDRFVAMRNPQAPASRGCDPCDPPPDPPSPNFSSPFGTSPGIVPPVPDDDGSSVEPSTPGTTPELPVDPPDQPDFGVGCTISCNQTYSQNQMEGWLEFLQENKPERDQNACIGMTQCGVPESGILYRPHRCRLGFQMPVSGRYALTGISYRQEGEGANATYDVKICARKAYVSWSLNYGVTSPGAICCTLKAAIQPITNNIKETMKGHAENCLSFAINRGVPISLDRISFEFEETEPTLPQSSCS